MKKYMLFAGYNYYPCGGMRDFQGLFETKSQALDHAIKEELTDWAQIINTETGVVEFYLDIGEDRSKVRDQIKVEGWGDE